VTRVIAFTGVAGTGIETAAERLARAIDPGTTILSIDREVWSQFAADARDDRRLREAVDLEEDDVRPESPPNWWHFLMLPPDRVRSYWRRGAERVLERIKADQPALVFLTFHAVYQSDQFRWRFSAVDPNVLRGLAIEDFFVLIDDIYDMYARRHQDRQAAKSLCIKQAGTWRGALMLLTQSISRLADYLRWRQEEINFTDYLAATLKARSHVIAVKHPLTSVRKIIEKPDLYFYFPHPITDVRRIPGFPDITEHVEIAVASEHLRAHMPIVEPTTIDELRFLPSRKRVDQPLPWLLPRWPVAGGGNTLLGEAPTKNERAEVLCWWKDAEDLKVAEKVLKLSQGRGPRPARDAVLSAVANLAALITEDITWRDHHLVNQTRRLIVYRPAFRGRPSYGVRREMEYYQRLAGSGNEVYRSVIFHPDEDRQPYIKSVAREIQQGWLKDPTIVKGVSGAALSLSSPAIVADLVEVLAENHAPGRAEAECVRVLEAHVTIEPEIKAPVPMGSGASKEVEQMTRVIRKEARSVAQKVLRGLGYLHRLEGQDVLPVEFIRHWDPSRI
jgi:hypothetical protein